MAHRPNRTLLFWVVFDGVDHGLPDREPHHIFELAHPVLYVFLVGIDVLDEGDLFPLGALHRGDLLVLIEVNLVDVLEHLLQVRLHCQRLLGLRENLKQVGVGEEVESGEFLPLFLEVRPQLFLDGLQVLVGLLQSFEESILGAHLDDEDALVGLLHGVLPGRINGLELFGLLHQLLGDVCGVEDRLEIHPLSLAFGPFLQNVTHDLELVVPHDDPLLERLLEGTELHGLGVDDVLV